MTISIVIPVYNVENYLATCLDSIMNQSYQDFEVILIDDGSKDNSPKICDKYAAIDSRFRVIHQPNSGVSNARNTGLSVAKSEWITFIDSDDWVDCQFLEDFQISSMEFSDSDMIVQGLKYVDSNTGTIKRYRRFPILSISAPDNEHYSEKCDLLSYGVTVCKCYRKDIIERYNIRFNENIDYHEDHLFAFDYIARCNTINTVAACGYNYRCGHNPNSLSKKIHTWEKMMISGNEMMRVLDKISSRYFLGDKYYKRIASFCLGPKIIAVETIYRNQISSQEKRYLLKQVLEPLSDFAKYYRGESFRRKPIRVLSKIGSFSLLHLFFSLNNNL